MFRQPVALAARALLFLALCAKGADPFPEVQNTQQESIPVVAAQEALGRVTAPEGFKTTLFAAEPEVRNPIGFTFDSRGRLWVAENYTYAEKEIGFDTRFRDRIIILEDTDGDGRADKRKVFWDNGDRLTCVALGFGGVYVLCAPKLLFIPDRDGDDVPDGEPEVLLDGFEERSIRHNLANGLKWGPDGWLYGRHGILASSHVGKPGTPADQRTSFSCAIWRFHPITRQFEVVVEGTTNPWGHDWDDYGEMFFINTVIGHLWHVVPGAFYKRMYGEHPNPYLYELIDQTADHVHWDTKEAWQDIRKLGVTEGTSKAGGGHAHSGFMIYLGDNWPAKYRNAAFTINYHGRRINQDTLARKGATYTATHNPDFAAFGDPWFRGVELGHGPDGGVYVIDWSDIGECHDDDGVHRTSGRIYKIVYGGGKAGAPKDLRKLGDPELVALQLHRNDWMVREARQILYERSQRTEHALAVHTGLRQMFEEQSDVTRKLRALWVLYVTGGARESWLRGLLMHENEHVRAWAVKFLVDKGASPQLLEQLTQVARSEKSGLVLCYLASVLHKAPVDQRWALAERLCHHSEFNGDPVFPLMIWYGIESAVPESAEQAVKLAIEARIPKVRSFLARRLTFDLDVKPEPVNMLVKALEANSDAAFRVSILGGMAEALRGWRRAQPPAGWPIVAPGLAKASDATVQKLTKELAVVFGDGRAAGELREVVANKKADFNSRRRALQTLVQSRAENLVPLIGGLLAELEMAPDAVRGLAALGDERTPGLLLEAYAKLPSYTAKVEAVNALASRVSFARPLLAAVETNAIRREEIGPLQVRQLRSLGDARINERLGQWWPDLHEMNAEKKGQILRFKERLTPQALSSGDPSKGRVLFGQFCGVCHVLFGEGGLIGPDLTGADRKNLAYLLNNVVDPSGVVAENYRVSTIRLKDGRVLNGVIGPKTERMLTVQTPTEKLVLERKEVESMTESEFSLMPEGLFESLKQDEIRDLLSYLMAAAPPPKQ